MKEDATALCAFASVCSAGLSNTVNRIDSGGIEKEDVNRLCTTLISSVECLIMCIEILVEEFEITQEEIIKYLDNSYKAKRELSEVGNDN